MDTPRVNIKKEKPQTGISLRPVSSDAEQVKASGNIIQKPVRDLPRTNQGIPMDDPNTLMDDTTVLMGGGIIVSHLPKVGINGSRVVIR